MCRRSIAIIRLAPTLKLLVLTLACVLTCAASPKHGQQDGCNKFGLALKTTYDFKPSRLAEPQRNAKSAAMDRFWDTVKANRAELLPCLRAALAHPQTDPWFRFDGSNLLVTLDPSQKSKAEQVRQHTAVDLNDVDLGFWWEHSLNLEQKDLTSRRQVHGG